MKQISVDVTSEDQGPGGWGAACWRFRTCTRKKKKFFHQRFKHTIQKLRNHRNQELLQFVLRRFYIRSNKKRWRDKLWMLRWKQNSWDPWKRLLEKFLQWIKGAEEDQKITLMVSHVSKQQTPVSLQRFVLQLQVFKVLFFTLFCMI